MRIWRDFQGNFPNAPGQHDAFDHEGPVGGCIESDLHCPEAVALEDDGTVAERLRGEDGRLDVVPDVEEVVGVRVLVVLSRANVEGGVSSDRQGASNHPKRERGEVAATAMHLHDDRCLGRRLVLWLPERGLNGEAVDRLDGQEPQRSAWQRLHVVGEAVGCGSRFVLDAGGDLGHAYGTIR